VKVSGYKGSKFLIYALFDPLTFEVRYVGASTCGLARPQCHLRPSGNLDRSDPRARWCSGLLARGLRPGLGILQELASEAGLAEAECQNIARFRSEGAALLNRRNGGGGISHRRRIARDVAGDAKARALQQAFAEFQRDERLREAELRYLRGDGSQEAALVRAS
jgi:hypothetical protein